MARNPYVVLGLAPMASDDDIRAAFRKLAKVHHPDRNPGDKRAEEKFKEISAAFEIIGDPERRKRYDRGELDDEGRERAPQFTYRPGAGGRGPLGAEAGEFADLGDIFSDLFGARPREGRPYGFNADRVRGRDLRYRLEVDFLEAARGAKKRVTMPDERSLDLVIPPAVEDGQTLRIRGQGEAGLGGGPPGDVYVEVKIKPHPIFTRDGLDIHIDAPVTLTEAVLGGKITVPTVAGDVSVTVPKGSSSGAVLRLRGRGLSTGKGQPAGDQFIKLKIVLPEGGDPDLEAFVRRWKAGSEQAPRKHFAGV